MAADEGSGDGESDVKLDILMEIAKDCLAHRIDHREFLHGSASFLEFGEDQEIMKCPSVEGTKKIFELAINRKRSQELLQLLKQNHGDVFDRLLNKDILSLCGTLSTDPTSKDEEYNWRLLHLLRGELYAKVDPREIMPYLCSHERSFLSPEESEVILEKDNRFDACLELVTTLARKRTQGSYHYLLRALIECGMREVAETIDPDRAKEISKHRDEGDGSIADGPIMNDLNSRRKRRYENISTASNVAAADSTSQAYSESDFHNDRHLSEVTMPHATSSRMGAEEAADSTRCKTVGNFVEAAGKVKVVPDSGDGFTEKLPDLRPYQIEVAEPALHGLNCVLCMPTNSGKTIVAVHAIAKHLSTRDGARVAFIAPQVALVNQQYSVLKKYLGYRYKIHCITGDAPEASALLQVSKVNDVLVLTPQILVNALSGVYAGDDNSASSRMDSLGIFTLLILDECHHCRKESPYNRMMSYYVKDKSLGLSPLPQVIGLTATLGVGTALSEEAAVEYILKICANLACEEPPKTVQREIKSLEDCVNVPIKERHRVQDRPPNEFAKCILAAMHRLESKLMTELKETPLESRWLLADPLKPAYEHQIHEMVKNVRECLADYPRKLEMSSVWLTHLQVYWKALEIWHYARNKDAHKLLEQNIQFSDTDLAKEAEELFKETTHQLERLLDTQEGNPRLDELARILRSKFTIGDTGSDRGLIFVKTRELTGALCDWVEELDGGTFKFLKPRPFTGVHSSAGSGGLTASGQDEVLNAFRDGETRLLVCTSVAEEGLDIPECKFCVQYLRASNVVSSIQARGRVRAANGTAHTISSEEGASKEELTWLRETLMEQAMTYICDMEITIFKAKIEEYQQQTLRAKEIAERSVTQQHRKVEENVKLRCGGCNINAVASADVRVFKEAHHIVTDIRFDELVSIRPSKKREKMGRDMIKHQKVSCKKCKKDWGIGMTMDGCSFFVLKMDPFVVETQDNLRQSYKKWKDFPYELQSIDEKELKEMGQKKIANVGQQ